jgi:transposase
MDNASWHHLDRIQQMCRDVGVVLVFLSLYSPDFNPIKEYFRVLKKFIKKKWHENEDFINVRPYVARNQLCREK